MLAPSTVPHWVIMSESRCDCKLINLLTQPFRMRRKPFGLKRLLDTLDMPAARGEAILQTAFADQVPGADGDE